MKKAIKIILIALVAIILVIAILSFSLIAFVSWVWGGIRFSPEAAIEAVGQTLSERERIESDDCYFYYESALDSFYNADEWGDWLYDVIPVVKNGVGMWYAVTDPSGSLIYADGSPENVGKLIVEEVNGKYHCFIIPFYVSASMDDPDAPLALPDGFPAEFDSITVNGEELELFKHSYFVTDSEITEFEIGGVRFTVGA